MQNFKSFGPLGAELGFKSFGNGSYWDFGTLGLWNLGALGKRPVFKTVVCLTFGAKGYLKQTPIFPLGGPKTDPKYTLKWTLTIDH